MANSNKPWETPTDPNLVRESAGKYDLDLPIAPAWFSERPTGSWLAGYELSLAALRETKSGPEMLTERARQRVDAEFIL
ncbi:MAG: hypothetical protein ISQ14_14805 [Verrucomicrobiae bacterium]|nr:hypothetical protein [Verrucomicrobiae bacterium]